MLDRLRELSLTPNDTAPCVVTGDWAGDTYTATLTNNGGEPTAIRAWTLLAGNLGVAPDTPIYGEGFQMLAQTEGTWDQPKAVGRCPDAGKYRINRDDGMHTVHNLLMVQCQSGWWLLGFSRCQRFSGAFQLIPGGHLRVVMDTENVTLQPGETWTSEPLEVLFDRSRQAVLQRFAQRVRAFHPRLPTKERPTGWCSWYHYHANVTLPDILENLDDRNRGFPALRYIQLDDGYQEHMGDWLHPSKRFGSGVEQLASRIRAAGCEPALWVAPFIAETASSVFQQHPDWFVRDGDGQPLPADEVTYGGWRNTPWFMLDGTHPAVQAHLRHLFGTMRHAWGIRYFKLDACYWGAVRGGYHDPGATRVQAYRAAMRAIIASVGDDAFVLGCNAPMWPSLGLVHGMRVSDDVRRDGSRIRQIARESLLRSWQNDELWVLDPDCVCLRNIPGETAAPEDYAFHLASHLACSGMVFSGDRLGDLDASQRRALALLASHAARAHSAEVVLNDDLSRADLTVGGQPVICLFNWGTQPRVFELEAGVSDLSTERNDSSSRVVVEPRCARILDPSGHWSRLRTGRAG